MHRTFAWRHDLSSSLVVFLVAVPLSLGIALSSGVPLMAGVVAGVVGAVVVGALSGSQLMVSGPAAGLTVVVLSSLSQLGSFETFLAAVMIAGMLQVAFGIARAGVIGYYFPSPVIKGMLSAIGLILILKQIPHALGYDADAMGDQSFQQANAETTFTAIFSSLEHIEPGAVVISTVALVVLWLWTRITDARLKTIPAPLVAVTVGIVLNALFSAVAPALALGTSHLVSLPVPASLGEFFGQLARPSWAGFADPLVWRVALMLAVVASLESLLALQATDDLDPYKREASTDRELLAQGAGNIVSGALGGLPLTGLIVRSATNIDSGAQTRRSTILHGVWLLLAAAIFPGLLNLIPLSALAAILLWVGVRLANFRAFAPTLRRGRSFALPFFVTVAAILLTDLLQGILLGLAVGVLIILRDHVRTPPYTEISPPGAVLRRLKLHEHLNFLHKAALLTELDALPEGSRIELDARATRRIDPDVREVLLNFRETARLRDIDYRLVGFPEPDIPALQ